MSLAPCKLKNQVNKSFLDLFSHDISDYSFDEHKTKLNLFILRIDSNQFTYSTLLNHLADAINSYCLSRVQYEAYEKARQYGQLHRAAVKKLIDCQRNDGEAGELLLYCFLEAHLQAPKILSKLELKTSSEDYIKGSDGIHLLDMGNNNYQLIFGESKLDKNLTTSLTEAFKSIHDFVTREKNNLYDEILLLDSNLLKEALNDKLYEFLKDVIMPKADGVIKKDNAFGIFAGFEIEITDNDKKLNNRDFENKIRKQIIKEVEDRYEHVKKKIEQYNLFGYNFYIYIFPFIDLQTNRRQIIDRLQHPGSI